MAEDAASIADRLKRYLPRWFGYSPDPRPVLDAVLAGIAAALADVHALIVFATLQSRIATSTGAWLDLTAFGFFGPTFTRFRGELDAGFSLRVRQEVLRERNTRGAIDSAVFDITGRHPHVFEGFHSPTCGGYGTPALAFGAAGRYGSRLAPFHVIVTTQAPVPYSIPNRGGWGSGTGGYGVGNFSFVDDSQLVGTGATKADIVAAIDRVRAAGTRIIVKFTSPTGSGGPDA